MVYALGIVTWSIALAAATVTGVLAVWGSRMWPEAPGSNCWVYVLPRYHAQGGYLIVRAAHGVRLFGFLQVPHVAWASTIPHDMEIEAYTPINRKRSKWLPWFVFWYRGVVSTSEKPHPAKPAN